LLVTRSSEEALLRWPLVINFSLSDGPCMDYLRHVLDKNFPLLLSASP
jgi:hypothetical protein